MKEVLVKRNDTRCDHDVADMFLAVLNGIVVDCESGGYRQGYRNQIMVNLVVASDMLGLDSRDVLNHFMAADLIDDRMDDESTVVRLNRIMRYDDRFCWNYMIDPGSHLEMDDKYGNNNRSLVFKLVD